MAEKACKANKKVGRMDGDFSRLWEGCQQEIQPGLRRTVTGEGCWTIVRNYTLL